ncbi:MAG TPA: hypothetical protein VIL87_08840 [Dermatophilaceae bacterium]|jgi:menaquinone-dependent protoporphyrinogen oxidase
MLILVGYASKHGATGEIAERIAEILDPGRLTFAEKTLRKLPAARAMMPEGDFRDWTEIDAWARSIAEELTQLDAGHVPEDP